MQLASFNTSHHLLKNLKLVMGAELIQDRERIHDFAMERHMERPGGRAYVRGRIAIIPPPKSFNVGRAQKEGRAGRNPRGHEIDAEGTGH